MKIDLDELERLAREASPGPWTTRSCNIYGRDSENGWEMQIYNEGGHSEADAAYIAAANPAVILELIRMVREKQHETTPLEWK